MVEIPALAQRLELQDFVLLQGPFLEALASFFPAQITMELTICSSATLTKTATAEDTAANKAVTSSTIPLDLPLFAEDGKTIILTLHAEDPALLQHLNRKWLLSQRDDLVKQLEIIRLAYLDTTSGCYNLSALLNVMQRGPRNENSSFLLLQIDWQKRQFSENLQRCAEAGTLLHSTMDAAFFHCGFGLFAAMKSETSLHSVRKSARLLQLYLRQEGYTKAQVVLFDAEEAAIILSQNGVNGFDEALDAVNRRGAFGLVYASVARERRATSFRLKNNSVFHQLKKAWRGLTCFTLVIFTTAQNECSTLLKQFQSVILAAGGELILAEPEKVLIFFANKRPEELRTQIAEIHKLLQEILANTDVAAGTAGWPHLDCPKKEIPSNCLKALLHASLLGSGHNVSFDQLSCNVSGDYFFEQGDYQTAIREYRRGLKLAPDDVNLLNSLGATLARFSREVQAIACFRQVLAHEPDDHMALANLGYILLNRGKSHEGMQFLERAYAVFPADLPMPRELLQSLASLYIEKNSYDKALLVLNKWQELAKSEESYLYHRLMGLALAGTGKMDKAIHSLELAVRLFPHDALSMAELGLLYLKRGETAELGLSFCRKAVELAPHKADLWCTLAKSLLFLENLDEALAAAQQCLKLQPRHADGLHLMALLALKKKSTHDAQYWLNRAVKFHTMSAENKKEIEKALAMLSQGVSEVP